MAPTPISDSSASLSPSSSLSPPTPTSASTNIEGRQDTELITLLITHPASTFTTFVLLGNTLSPSSSALFPSPTTYPVSSSPDTETDPIINNDANPGLGKGTLAGIVVGCVGSFFLLLGVGYVYMLRARQGNRFNKRFGGGRRVARRKVRRRKKVRRRRDGDAAAGGDGGAPEGGGGDPPAAPAEEAAPAPEG